MSGLQDTGTTYSQRTAFYFQQALSQHHLAPIKTVHTITLYFSVNDV